MSAETVATARRRLAAAFRAAGFDAPETDARLLAGHALGLDHGGLIAAGERMLTGIEQARIAALAERRLSREPVAQIVGVKEFWGLPLRVTADTLIPRPDTETVVEAVLALVDRAGSRDSPLRIADLGTGSGAILLALLSELPAASGVGTDRSAAALRIARENAAALGLAGRAMFICGDFSAALRESFDLVVSNPPYIPTADIETLDGEVRMHEPHAALDGGADGLSAYRAILGDAGRLLAPGGSLVLEIGCGQEPAVAALARAAGLRPTAARRDLAGIPRALSAALVPAPHPSQAAQKELGISAGTD